MDRVDDPTESAQTERAKALAVRHLRQVLGRCA